VNRAEAFIFDKIIPHHHLFNWSCQICVSYFQNPFADQDPKLCLGLFSGIINKITFFFLFPFPALSNLSGTCILKLMEKDACTSWIEIDLDAIKNNIHQFITRCPASKVMAVVKANGYGHGIVETSRAAISAGAAWCGVARLEEGLMLRNAGIGSPILVFGYTHPAAVGEAVANRISLSISNRETAAAYAALAKSLGKSVLVHVKIDTGMGRLGVLAEDGLEFFRWLNSLQDALDVEGVFTHFARSDETSLPTTHDQLSRFWVLIKTLEENGLRPRLAHTANSAGSLSYPESHFDMVRPGIAIYGASPYNDDPLPEGFRPALTWKGRLGSVKIFPPGHGIGYGYRYITQRTERIGTIAMGYADGLRRRPGNWALCHGMRVMVVGTVCMDQCMVQLEKIPEAKVGDEVVFIGQQGDAVISVKEVADAWETIPHEVFTGLAARLPRFYSK
jgi:alanine racemase